MNPLGLLLCALCATQLVLAVPNPAHSGDLWAAYKAKHGKTYESEAVETARKTILAENKQTMDLFNEHLSESAGFTLGLNHLSDRTEEEIKQLRGFKASQKRRVNSAHAERFLKSILDSDEPIPAEVDWRKVPHRVSAVKDQGQCGSCWAFATTGLLEGQQVALNKSATLTPLSEQNLLDCTDADYGCGGGIMDDALDQIHREGGINSEASYPYEAKEGPCRFNPTKVIMTDKAPVNLNEGDEQQLKKVVARYGPVSVAIDASSTLFQLYSNGVFSNPKCSPTNLDHGVLVVGYGTDAKQGDYWIVKNSWTDQWGEDGYIRMARNKNNQCGIATHAVVAAF